MKKKLFISVVAVALVACFAIGGTLAWLTDKTDPKVNTFTVGDISIDLTETDRTYKMIPGYTIDKDPKVSVDAGSEDCYLFVKVEKSSNFDNFMTYTMADDWKELESGVYYRVVKTTDVTREFSVLKDDKVSVLGTVTKDMLNKIENKTEPAPTLTFTAYAVQLHKSNTEDFTAAEAWATVNSVTP